MNGLNGIIINGKAYEAVESDDEMVCPRCELRVKCNTHKAWDFCGELLGHENGIYLRFSQELTDKINEK